MKRASSEFLDLYRRELLRWNTGMNLLSRRDPEGTCRGLLEQCEFTAGLLWNWMEARGLAQPGASISYADLGSGAGLPGVVWSRFFSDRVAKVQSILVEPREKRAWFLRRVSELEGAAPFQVLRGRWGEVETAEVDREGPGAVVISLKALRMNDFQILSGLSAGMGLGSNLAAGLKGIVIARFCPPEQILDSSLEASLDSGIQDILTDLAGCVLKPRGRDILGPTKGLLPASLVLTWFDVTAR